MIITAIDGTYATVIDAENKTFTIYRVHAFSEAQGGNCAYPMAYIGGYTTIGLLKDASYIGSKNECEKYGRLKGCTYVPSNGIGVY